jgi:hypothetical protein
MSAITLPQNRLLLPNGYKTILPWSPEAFGVEIAAMGAAAPASQIFTKDLFYAYPFRVSVPSVLVGMGAMCGAAIGSSIDLGVYDYTLQTKLYSTGLTPMAVVNQYSLHPTNGAAIGNRNTVSECASYTNTADATSYATGNWTPRAGETYFAYVLSSYATTPVVPTLSGNNLTWTNIGTVTGVAAATAIRITAFVAQGAAPALGATTADFGADTQTGCIISVQGVENSAGSVWSTLGTDANGGIEAVGSVITRPFATVATVNTVLLQKTPPHTDGFMLGYFGSNVALTAMTGAYTMDTGYATPTVKGSWAVPPSLSTTSRSVFPNAVGMTVVAGSSMGVGVEVRTRADVVLQPGLYYAAGVGGNSATTFFATALANADLLGALGVINTTNPGAAGSALPAAYTHTPAITAAHLFGFGPVLYPLE